MSADRDIGSEVLDLFTDEDDEIDVGVALDTLLGVVGGLCLLGEDQTPLQLAESFGSGLKAGVIAASAPQGRLS